MQIEDLARYVRLTAAAAVAVILAWSLLRRRDFSFRRFQALVRWAVGITILAVLVSDMVEGPIWNARFLLHLVVFVGATAVMTVGYVRSRKIPDVLPSAQTILRPARGSQGKGVYVAGAIGLSILWVAYEQLRPMMTDGLAGALRDYGWAFLGAAWGVAVNPRLAAAGVKRSKLLAFGYAFAVFAACAIVTRSGDVGRMIAPGLFLVMQVPVLRMPEKTAEA